jgi:hypothetical protein
VNFFRIAIRVASKRIAGAPIGLGHGWWIMPDGSIVDVPYGAIHAAVAETLINRDELSDEWFNATADDILIDQGAIAIRLYSGSMGSFSITLKDLSDQNLHRIIELVAEETDEPDRDINIEEISTNKFRQYTISEFMEFSHPSEVWKKQYACQIFDCII